jgi:immune inhibitor A
MKKAFIISCMALIAISLFAMPMSPELMERLKAEGEYYHVIEILKEAKANGVDEPNPNPISINRGERTTLNAIVILVDFNDNVATTDTLHFDSLLSSIGAYPTGSFRDYYLENSYNNVDIIATVVGWYRMPQNYTYYTNGNYGFGSYPQNAQRMAEDAVWAADPYVDFSQYDNDGDNYVDALFIVHAGPGAEVTGNPNHIWSHKWSTHDIPNVDGVWAWTYSTEPEDGKVGVFAHETGHALFGLPDLYDYDYDSYGCGNWTIMAGGSWNGGGTKPAHLDAWCKIESGFLDPVVPTSNLTGVQFPAVEYDSVVYKLWSYGTPTTQYFLVENRRKTGFDQYIPFAGLVIYHVDETMPHNDWQWYPGYTDFGHYKVAVEQADGYWHMEKNTNGGDVSDPWPGTLNRRTFNDSTIPDTKDYYFSTTYVAVENISDAGDTMTADIKVKPTGIEEILGFDYEIPGIKVCPSIAHSEFNISFAVESKHKSVNLKIYDATGRLVKSFSNLNTALKKITWYGNDNYGNKVSPGVYFIQLTTDSADNFGRLEKIILVK